MTQKIQTHLGPYRHFWQSPVAPHGHGKCRSSNPEESYNDIYLRNFPCSLDKNLLIHTNKITIDSKMLSILEDSTLKHNQNIIEKTFFPDNVHQNFGNNFWIGQLGKTGKKIRQKKAFNA